MAFLIILVVVVGGLWYRLASPAERERVYVVAVDSLVSLKAAATRPRPEYDEFQTALRRRMRFALVTGAIAVIVTAVFVRMLLDAAAITPDTLLAFGASTGMRTTHGEWWRLATAPFLHTGTLHLLVDLAALIQLGLILERLVGRAAFAAAYLFAAVFDTLVNLSSHPLAVTVSASGAIFGLYGLLCGTLVWQRFHGWRRRSVMDEAPAEPQAEESDLQEQATVDVVVPFIALKRLAIVGVIFMAYSLFSGRMHTAEFSGLLVGLMIGVVFARRACVQAPRTRDVLYGSLAVTVVTVVAAIGIGRITDVKPEIARVLALEKSTAAEYHSEFEGFRAGRVTATALAQFAEDTIVNELLDADTRLKALTNVPSEHQQVVADAREYVRLRCASWRARGAAIRRAYVEQPLRPEGVEDTVWRMKLQAKFNADNAVRATAEGAERTSLEAYERIARF